MKRFQGLYKYPLDLDHIVYSKAPRYAYLANQLGPLLLWECFSKNVSYQEGWPNNTPKTMNMSNNLDFIDFTMFPTM